MSAFTIAAYSAINLALVFIGRGSIGQLFALSFACLIGLVSICIGAFILLIGRISGGASPTYRRFSTRAISFGFVAGSCLVSWPFGFLLGRSDIEQARNFCDRLRPRLEHHRSKTGRYPEHISEVSESGQLPRLLQKTEFYQANGSEYSFMFSDPSAMLGGFGFDSRSRVWDEWD